MRSEGAVLISMSAKCHRPEGKDPHDALLALAGIRKGVRAQGSLPCSLVELPWLPALLPVKMPQARGSVGYQDRLCFSKDREVAKRKQKQKSRSRRNRSVLPNMAFRETGQYLGVVLGKVRATNV
jgi:hypothetical protein